MFLMGKHGYVLCINSHRVVLQLTQGAIEPTKNEDLYNTVGNLIRGQLIEKTTVRNKANAFITSKLRVNCT